MAEILTLPPQAAPTELTAKRPSKTLKEHEEAFKSINGFEESDPKDYTTEISGIVADVMTHKCVTRKMVQDGGRLIRDVTERKIRLNQGARIILSAMGYVDLQDAGKKNEGLEYFVNLNYDRKDLVSLSQEITAEHLRLVAEAKVQLRPMFERVFALPYVAELAALPRGKTGQAVLEVLKDYLVTLNWDLSEVSEIWKVANALAYRYPNLASLRARRDLCRPDTSTRKVWLQAAQELAVELRSRG